LFCSSVSFIFLRFSISWVVSSLMFLVHLSVYSLCSLFHFFPRVGVRLSRGYAALAQGCLWEFAIPRSSPFPHLPKPYGHGRVAARGPSLFFRLTWSGDSLCLLEVEGSKFCLFLVILPAKCVSGVSPRFPYRRLTFCFLPLAAILEYIACFLSFDLIFVFWLSLLLARFVCYFCPLPGGII
jgi:hypothetical protein